MFRPRNRRLFFSALIESTNEFDGVQRHVNDFRVRSPIIGTWNHRVAFYHPGVTRHLEGSEIAPRSGAKGSFG